MELGRYSSFEIASIGFRKVADRSVRRNLIKSLQQF